MISDLENIYWSIYAKVLILKKKIMDTKKTLELLISKKLSSFSLQNLIQIFAFLESVENVSNPSSKKVNIRSLQGALSHCKANSYDFMKNKEFEKSLER